MVYLDCNATTPMEPEVREAMLTFMDQEFGNEGSRTHLYGSRAKKAVADARASVAAIIAAENAEILFTSGATESNNLGILGLKEWAKRNNKKHILSSEIEHKAVLEPLLHMKDEGFEIEFIKPGIGGRIEADIIRERLRPNTALVAIMHVNNETGVIQPINEICKILKEHPAYLFVDAAQSFGKLLEDLRDTRIDLISASAHKLYGPKGIGCLVMRSRLYEPVPLQPLMYGGGQEQKLRPGTLPVHQIVGFGKACEVAIRDNKKRSKVCEEFKTVLVNQLKSVGAIINGDLDHTIFTTINCSLPEINSEALIVLLKDLVAISNGSACTSTSYKKSYVLNAMGLSNKRIENAIRLSFCHLTPKPNYSKIIERIKSVGS